MASDGGLPTTTISNTPPRSKTSAQIRTQSWCNMGLAHSADDAESQTGRSSLSPARLRITLIAAPAPCNSEDVVSLMLVVGSFNHFLHTCRENPRRDKGPRTNCSSKVALGGGVDDWSMVNNIRLISPVARTCGFSCATNDLEEDS